jgi:CheY-like chemotaxis protein
MNKILNGKVVFIVEDDELSALTMKDFVEGLGCEVVGHARTLEQALALAAQSEFDIALLDIDLDGETSYALAQWLALREVPFVFTTGKAEGGPAWCRDRPRVLKPFSGTLLERMMEASLMHPQTMSGAA